MRFKIMNNRSKFCINTKKYTSNRTTDIISLTDNLFQIHDIYVTIKYHTSQDMNINI